MSWKQEYKGNKLQQSVNNATDGDLYIAYALLEASEVWSVSNYKEQSIKILNDIVKYNYNSKINILTLGNWVDTNNEVIGYSFRSSDYIPMFFNKFYKITNDKVWNEIDASMKKYMKDVQDTNKSGLISDFVQVDVKTNKGMIPQQEIIKGSNSSNYTFDAIRVPMQLAFDSSNQDTMNMARKITYFFENQNVIYAWYNLDGNPIVDWSSVATEDTIAYTANKVENTNLYNRLKSAYENHQDGGYYADIIHALAYYSN